MSVPGYATDDETAIRVIDGAVEVFYEGRWKLFTPNAERFSGFARDLRPSWLKLSGFEWMGQNCLDDLSNSGSAVRLSMKAAKQARKSISMETAQIPKNVVAEEPEWLAKATALKQVTLERLTAMPEPERDFASPPAEWSASGIVEHLILVEECVAGSWRENLVSVPNLKIGVHSGLVSRAVSFVFPKQDFGSRPSLNSNPRAVSQLERWNSVRLPHGGDCLTRWARTIMPRVYFTQYSGLSAFCRWAALRAP